MKTAFILCLAVLGSASSHALVSRVSPRVVRPANFGAPVSFHAPKTDALKPLAGITRFTPVLQVGTPAPQPVSFANGTKIAALTQTERFSRASNEAIGGAGRAFFDQAVSLKKESEEPVDASGTPEKKKAPLGQRIKRAALIGSLTVVPAAAIAFLLATDGATDEKVAGIILTIVTFGLIWWTLLSTTRSIRRMMKAEAEAVKKFVDEKGPELLKIPGVKSVEAVPMTDEERDSDFPMHYLVVTVDHLGADNDAQLPETDYRIWSPMFRAHGQFLRMGRIGDWPVGIKLAK